MALLPPKDYYEYMYDIEGLTTLNVLRKSETGPTVKKAEELIRAQQCTDALHLLRKPAIQKNNKMSEIQMLISALWAKDRLFEGVVEEVEEKSPKFCALHELSEYLNQTEKDVEKKMLVEVPVQKDWKRMKINPNSHEDVTRFYRETNSYVYELMAANHIVQTLFTFAVMTERMQRLGVQTVLDFGGGAGTLSILLSRLGYQVTYADLPSRTADFAEWRFAKRGLDIPMIELQGDESADLKASNFKNTSFDCILSTEVVEHVLHPLELIRSFAEKLPLGGVAVVSESCEYTEHFASHLENNKQYGGINFIRHMNEAGFEQLPVEFFIPQQIFIKS